MDGMTSASSGDIPMTDLPRASEMFDSSYQQALRWLDSHAEVWTESRVS